MDDLTARRRAIAGRAALTARIGGRQPTRDQRRLLDHYNEQLGIERRDRSTVSVEILHWCRTRNDPAAPLTTDERAAFGALVDEHRALAAPVPPRNTTSPELDQRRRRAALWN